MSAAGLIQNPGCRAGWLFRTRVSGGRTGECAPPFGYWCVEAFSQLLSQLLLSSDSEYTGKNTKFCSDLPYSGANPENWGLPQSNCVPAFDVPAVQPGSDGACE